MLSRYFKFKINTEEFKENVKQIISEFKGNRVLICGESEGFKYLDKQYKFSREFSITGFVCTNDKRNDTGIQTVDFSDISKQEIDFILITGEDSDCILNKFPCDFDMNKIPVKSLFIESIKDGKQNLEYLLKYKFDKYLPILVKKLKGKTAIFYGAGVYLELIQHYFDISELNVIGITDRKYKDVSDEQEIYGYKICKFEQITELNPDYVIITAKRFIPIWESLYFGFLEKTKIKIIPILKKNIFALLCEMADS